MARKAANPVPKPSRSAELIVRQGFVIDATGKGPLATPEVVILGNRDGLRYLSALFAHLAERAGARAAASENDDSIPLAGDDHPINGRLSDDLRFRFAAVGAANREAQFKRFGITMKSKQKGSLFERYEEVVSQFGRLAERLKRGSEQGSKGARDQGVTG
ncbi:MAG: hypothetical protein U1D55_13645 [Phycisphaerae bacterium]